MKLLFLCSPTSATFLSKRKQKSYKQNTYPGSGINQGPVSQEATNYFHLPSTCCHVQRRFSTLQKSKKVSVSQTSVKKQSSDAANSAHASARVETRVSAQRTWLQSQRQAVKNSVCIHVTGLWSANSVILDKHNNTPEG